MEICKCLTLSFLDAFVTVELLRGFPGLLNEQSQGERKKEEKGERGRKGGGKENTVYYTVERDTTSGISHRSLFSPPTSHYVINT
jgi:hypothetical protein